MLIPTVYHCMTLEKANIIYGYSYKDIICIYIALMSILFLCMCIDRSYSTELVTRVPVWLSRTSVRNTYKGVLHWLLVTNRSTHTPTLMQGPFLLPHSVPPVEPSTTFIQPSAGEHIAWAQIYLNPTELSPMYVHIHPGLQLNLSPTILLLSFTH